MEAPKGNGLNDEDLTELLEGEKTFLFEQIRRLYASMYPDMPATRISDITAHNLLLILDTLSSHFGIGAKIYLLSGVSQRLWAENEGITIPQPWVVPWADPAPEDGGERESSTETDCAVPHPAPSEHPHPLGASSQCHPPPVHPAAGDAGTST